MSENDWRLTNQINYLKEKELIYSNYTKRSDSWEHDHCEFCFEKFYDESQYGYHTLNSYHWVCEDCFNDFLKLFKWILR